MTNKVLIGVFIVIALALGGAGISWVKNNIISSHPSGSQSVEKSASPSANLATPSPNQSQQTSLKDLWRSGVSQKCTFSDDNTTGTTYISNGQMKGDFSSSIEGQTITSHIIVQENSSYVWMDGQNQGYKVSIENISQQIGASSSGTIDLNREFNVQCQPSAVDSSRFAVPQDIQFQDMGSINEQNTTKATSSGKIDLKAAQCGACDKLPGGAKDQCKKALSCTN